MNIYVAKYYHGASQVAVVNGDSSNFNQILCNRGVNINPFASKLIISTGMLMVLSQWITTPI